MDSLQETQQAAIHGVIEFGGGLSSCFLLGESVAATFESGRLAEVRLRAQMDVAVFNRCLADSLFGLAPEVLGPQFGGSGWTQPKLTIELRLLDHLLVVALDGCRTAAEVSERLRRAKTDSQLRDPRCWRALTVVERRGAVEAGLATTWLHDWPEPAR